MALFHMYFVAMEYRRICQFLGLSESSSLNGILGAGVWYGCN